MKKLAALLILAAACGPGLVEFPSVTQGTGPGGGGPPGSPAVCAATPGLVYCGAATCDTLGVLHCGLNNGVCESCPGGYSCSSGVCAPPSTCGKGLILGAGSCVNATRIAAGGNTSCAIAAQGATTGVYCWGANESGQLGPAASGTSSSIANEIAALRGASAVAVGTAHGCAIVGTSVFCWGSNDSGQIGSGAPASGSATPVVIPEASGATVIAAGGRHSCAITSAGAVCWGATDFGKASPIQEAKGATKIVAGDNHTCAMLPDRVVCWGANESGQMGNGTTAGPAAPSTVPLPGNGIVDLAAGSNHNCALVSGPPTIDSTNTLQCWGSNGSSQILSNGAPFYSSPVPRKAFSSNSFPDAVAAGRAHTCVKRGTDGACIGDTSLGQTSISLTPNLGGPISAGGDHTCYIDAANTLHCFGRNLSSELGPFGP